MYQIQLPETPDAAAVWLRECLYAASDWPISGDIGDVAARVATREAAVLVPLVWYADEPVVLLTRRGAHLRHHGGQVAFPGGKIDADDVSPEAAALREAYEEIALSPSVVRIVGRLPHYVTVTAFKVTPIVGVIVPPYEVCAAQSEVDEIFEVPLNVVCDMARYIQTPYEHQGRTHQVLTLPYRHYHIWGATAAMLRIFAEVVRV